MSLVVNLSEMLFNLKMKTVEETRLDRLALLKAEFKSYAELSRLSGISEAQFSQWAKRSIDHKTKRARTMHSDSARRLEIATNKPAGWMDQPVYENKEKIQKVIDIMETMTMEQAEELKTIASVLARRHIQNK